MRRPRLRILEQRFELVAYVAVVATSLFPDRQKHFLRAFDQFVGQAPGDLLIVDAIADQVLELLVEAAGLDEIGNDNRIRRRAGSSQAAVQPD